MRAGKYRQFIAVDCVRLSNSLSEQLRAQVATGPQQAWQEALFQLIAADSPGMGTDVERGYHLAGSVVHRHGNRPQALFQFLVDDAPALLPHLLQAFKQCLGVCKVRLVLACRSAWSR